LFQVVARFAAQRGDVGFLQYKGQVEGGGQIADEGGVLARLFAAKLMIQVEHGEAQIPARGELAQNVQQAYGVRTAGDRHAHALVGLKHAITCYSFRDFFQHYCPIPLFYA